MSISMISHLLFQIWSMSWLPNRRELSEVCKLILRKITYSLEDLMMVKLESLISKNQEEKNMLDKPHHLLENKMLDKLNGLAKEEKFSLDVRMVLLHSGILRKLFLSTSWKHILMILLKSNGSKRKNYYSLQLKKKLLSFGIFLLNGEIKF